MKDISSQTHKFNHSNTDMSSNRPEIIQLTNEAIKLATAACHFDKQQNIVGACDYYDKCLLNIDEVLNKLQPNSEEWKKLLAIRLKYDDRMEHLRDSESSKYNFAGGGGKIDSRSMVVKRSARKRVMFNDDSYTVDATLGSSPLEKCPENLAEIPYWQLRNINKTIQDGGFLTPDVFIPKKIWTNAAGIKFSGLAAKTTAFEIVIKCIVNNIEVLYPADDDDSLSQAESAFSHIEEELYALQNQLSKPFPFIKDVSQSPYTAVNITAAMGGSTNAHTSIATSRPSTAQTSPDNVTVGAPNLAASQATVMTSSLLPGDHPEAEHTHHQTVTTAPSVTGHVYPSATGTPSLQDSPSGSKNTRTFATMVSSLGKNMKKYAELGYQRFVVALPSRMSADDMVEYTALISKLCEKCQILDTWFKFVLNLKLQRKIKIDSTGDESAEPDTPPPSVATVSVSAVGSTVPNIKNTGRRVFTDSAIMQIDTMLNSLQNISSYIRGIVCEILLRDIENLVDRYLIKTRKTFARMYWDDDVEYVE